jgi:hypothetical protein
VISLERYFMTDFRLAFRNGQEAAKNADASRAEINSIFIDLNQQLGDVSNGRVSIQRYQFERPRSAVQQIALILLPPDRYWGIGATNPLIAGMQPEKLCNWEEDRAGYPCKLIWDGDEYYCQDKQSLEDTLKKMLSDPIVGKTLSKIINLDTNLR